MSTLSDISHRMAPSARWRWPVQFAALTILGIIGLPTAQAQGAIPCIDGALAEGVGATGHVPACLGIQKFEPPPSTGNARLLVVYVDGDNRSRLAVESGTAFNLSEQLKATTVALQTPASPVADPASPGNAGQGDYSARSIAIVAKVLEKLRAQHVGKKILLVGHGGGAALAGLLAGRFPGSADAYLLAACPCDMPRWLQWRQASTGTPERAARSLSPQEEVAKISPATRMALVVGNKDDNTLAKFSETYVASLQRQGVKTRLTYAMGATHVSVLRSPEFFMLAQSLAAELSR